MKKNFFGFLFSFLLCFGFYGLASAEVFTTLPSPQVLGTNIVISCSDSAHKFRTYSDDGIATSSSAKTCAGYSFNINYGSPDMVVNIVECDPALSACSNINYSDALTDAGFVSQIAFTFTAPLPPPPPTATGYEGGLLYPRDPITGASDANLLIASVATSTQDTFGSLGPVLALIGGIILAFIVIKWIIGLVKSTNDTKNNKTRV